MQKSVKHPSLAHSPPGSFRFDLPPFGDRTPGHQPRRPVESVTFLRFSICRLTLASDPSRLVVNRYISTPWYVCSPPSTNALIRVEMGHDRGSRHPEPFALVLEMYADGQGQTLSEPGTCSLLATMPGVALACMWSEVTWRDKDKEGRSPQLTSQ